MMKPFALTLLLAGAVMCCGCVTNEDVLVPRPCSQMRDVDVPTRFTFDAMQSFDFADMTTKERFAVHYFRGKAPFDRLIDFYRKNMPVHGWRLRQEVGSRGLKTLYFKKGNPESSKTGGSTCIVTVFSKDGTVGSIQIIRIEQ